MTGREIDLVELGERVAVHLDYPLLVLLAWHGAKREVGR